MGATDAKPFWYYGVLDRFYLRVLWGFGWVLLYKQYIYIYIYIIRKTCIYYIYIQVLFIGCPDVEHKYIITKVLRVWSLPEVFETPPCVLKMVWNLIDI